jgi:hypothetical protein
MPTDPVAPYPSEREQMQERMDGNNEGVKLIFADSLTEFHYYSSPHAGEIPVEILRFSIDTNGKFHVTYKDPSEAANVLFDQHVKGMCDAYIDKALSEMTTRLASAEREAAQAHGGADAYGQVMVERDGLADALKSYQSGMVIMLDAVEVYLDELVSLGVPIPRDKIDRIKDMSKQFKTLVTESLSPSGREDGTG